MSGYDTVSVVASGWSLTDVDVTRIPGVRIGVNDSAWRIGCTWGVTMDRLFLENRIKELSAAFENVGGFFYRRGIDKNVSPPSNFIPFDNNHESIEMTGNSNCLNGTNSGLCAVSLAFSLVPRRVLLWGFDMCRNPITGAAYYHDPYPWAKPGGATSNGRYAVWAMEFDRVAAQFKKRGIEVLNASPVSKITAFPKIKPEQAYLT